MKNPERVAELLAALKTECEYRFEFDAVDKLAQAISELPRVTVIDDRHQEFCGAHFHKANKGDFVGRKNNSLVKLHRVVWSHYFGDIPDGYIIHHVDGDKENNQIENLQLMTHGEHSRLHHSDGVYCPPKKIFTCVVCGKEYEAYDQKINKFCSAACAQKYYRARRQPLQKNCAYCGKPFTSLKKKTRFCSHHCAMKYRWEKD